MAVSHISLWLGPIFFSKHVVLICINSFVLRLYFYLDTTNWRIQKAALWQFFFHFLFLITSLSPLFCFALFFVLFFCFFQLHHYHSLYIIFTFFCLGISCYYLYFNIWCDFIERFVMSIASWHETPKGYIIELFWSTKC